MYILLRTSSAAHSHPTGMRTQRRLLPIMVCIAAGAVMTPVSAFTTLPPAAFNGPTVSAPLHAFTASTSTDSSQASATAAQKGDPILDPKGKHYRWYSLKPIKEVVPWAKRSAKYFADLIDANEGASVFKGHPGLKVTFLTDYASAEWFLSQPETVLDRQDGAYFGPLKCRKEYIGDSLPTLISNQKESHLAFREHAMGAFRSRVPYGQPAMTRATDIFYNNLWENGMGEYTNLYEFFLQQTTYFLHEWVYGLGQDGAQPLPPFKDFVTANPIDVSVLIKLEMDTPVANALVKLAQRGKKPSVEQLASVDSILDAIRSSTVWDDFVDRIKSSNVDPKDLERSFMFTTNFQSAVAIAKQMRFVVATLTNNPKFLEDLRQEVDGKELTFETVKGADNFPLLDGLHWEINRLWPAPSFTVKIAQTDAVVPTTSGKKYQVNKGDALCCEQALAMMDPSIFGSDAREFNPKRFLQNPDLKKKVFAYGYVDLDNVEGKQFGCPAHAIGMLDGILKIFFGKWVQEAEWELTAPAVVDTDEFNGEIGPADLSFAKVTPRKKSKEGGKGE